MSIRGIVYKLIKIVAVKKISRIQAVLSIILITLFSQNIVFGQSAGTDKTIVCDNTVLSATGGPGTWTSIPGGVVFTPDAITANATATFPGYGNYALTWTIGVTPYTVNITRHDVTASGTLNANCATASLVGSNPGGSYTGLWTANNGAVTFSDPSSSTTTASNLPPGIAVTFTWTVTIEGCSEFQSFILTNTTPVGVDAGGDPVTEDAEVCTNHTYNLSAGLGTGISGTWSFQTGDGIFDDSTSPSAIVSTLVPGTNILRWTVVNGVCSTVDDITLYNNSVTATASNQTVCASTANFDGNLPVTVPATTGLWENDPLIAPPVISAPTNPTSGVSNLQVGANDFTWTLTKGTCTHSVSITITRDPLVATAGPDQANVCATTAIMAANNPDPGETGTWSLIAGSGTFSNSNLNTAAVSGLNASTPNIFRWTVTRPGCTAVSDEVTITSNALPVDAGLDQTDVCGTSTSLSAISGDPSGSGGSGVWSTVTSATILTPSNFTTTINNLPTATSTFRWTVTKSGCSVWDEVQVTRSAYAVNAGPDQSVCANSAVLNGSDPGPGGSGQWIIQSGAGSITNPLSRNTTVTNITSFPLVVRWTLTGGACVGEFDEVTISNQGTTIAEILNAPSDDVAPCGATTYNLSAVNPAAGGETITWYEAAPVTGVGFLTPNAQNTVANNLTAPGSYTIVLEIADGVCTNLDTIVLNTYAGGSANAGPNIGTPTTCSAFLNLNATPPAIGTGMWSVVPGDPMDQNVWFQDPTNPTTAVRTFWPASGGKDAPNNSFALRWTVTNGSCVFTDDITVQNDAIAYAGVDQFQCGSAIFQMNAGPLSNNNGGNRGWWTFPPADVDVPPGNQDYWSDTELRVISPFEGAFNAVWHYTQDGCTSTDTVVIYFLDDLSDDPMTAGANQTICGTTANITDATLPSTLGVNTSGLWSAGGSASFNPINSPTTTVSNLSAGINTLTWTITNGCSSVADDITINVSAITGTDAGDDQTICEDYATFDATPAPVGGNGTWSVKSGGGIISTPTAANSTVTSLLQGRNVFLWSVTSPFCNAVDSVVIYSGKPPTPNAGPDRTFCGSGAMQGVPPTSGTAQWSVVSGGATIVNPNLATTNVTPLVSPSILRWTRTLVAPNGLNCTSYDDVTVIDNTPTTAFAGADQTGVCGTTGLAANTPAAGESGLWQTVAGTGTFANNTQAVTNITNMQLGLNTYRWTITKGTCTSVDEVNITSDAIVANITTPDQSTCNTSMPLVAVDPTPATGLWTPMGTPATLTSTTNFATTANGLQNGANTFEWRVTYGACVTTDFVTISNYTITAANAGAPQSVCTGSATLSGNLPNYGAGEIGTWSSPFVPGVTFSNQTSTTATASNLQIGNNTLRWTIDNGSCSDFDDVVITVTSYSVEAGNPQAICVNNTTLIGSEPAPGTGTWSLQSGSGAFTTPNSSTTVVTGITSTTNVYRWTVTLGACNFQDDVTVTLNTPTTANAGADQIACGPTATLDADPVTVGVGTWTSSSGGVVIANPTFHQSGVSNLPGGATTFTWTVTNGTCSSVDQVTIYNNSFTISGVNPPPLCVDTTRLQAVDPAPGTGLWTVRSGSGTFDNPTYYRSIVRNIGREDNIYRWTITNGGCSDFVDITVSNYSVTADAGLDNYSCTGAYQLQGNNPNTQDITIPNLPAIGTWTTPGPSVIANINLYNTNVTGLNPNANTFIWTIDNGTCSDFDEVIISNDMPTIPNAGPDETFCGIDFAPNGYNSIYNSLTANAPVYGRDGIGETGVWTQVAGTSTFLDANTTLNLRVDDLEYYAQLGGPDYWSLQPTVNTYRWTITYKLCELYDEVTITNAAPFPAEAGVDQDVCWYDANLNATDLGSGAQLHWWEATPSTNINFYDPQTGATVTGSQNMPFNSYTDSLQIGTTTFTWLKENTINAVTCRIWNAMDVTRINSNIGTTTAGTNQVVCSTEAQLFASDPNSVFPGSDDVTGQWSYISGYADFADATSNSTTATNLDYTTNILRWTITNNTLGCDASNDVYITNALPSNANIGGPDPVYRCTNTVTLAAERPTRGTGYWTILGGGGNITNNSCISAICNVYVTGLGQGTNSILWTTSNTFTDPATSIDSTCRLTDTVTVINNSIQANAGSDLIVCNDSASLNANLPLTASGSWSVTGGSGTILDPTNRNTMVIGLSPDLNTLTWTITNGFCTNSDDINIINNNPEDPSAGADQALCTNTTTLAANNPIAGMGTGSWSVYTGNGVFSNSLSATTIVSSIPVQANIYRWTITKNNCSEFDDVIIDNNSVTPLAGSDISKVCGEEVRISSVQLGASPPLIGETGSWSVANSTGTVQTPSAFDSYVTGMDDGENIFRWTVTNGACTANDLVSVFVYIPTTANAGSDNEVCASSLDNISLNGNLPTRGSGTWSYDLGGGTFANETLFNTTISSIAYDRNTYVWTVNHNGCLSSDTVAIVNNYVLADAGSDLSICVADTSLSGNDPIAFFYTGQEYPTGQWTVANGTGTFANSTLYNSAITGLSTAMTNTFRWTLTKGICSDDDVVSIDNNYFTITAGPNQVTCNANATMAGTQPGGGNSGVWNYVLGSGTGTIVSTSAYNTQITGMQPGDNNYTWTVFRDGCSATDTVRVTNNTVTADAGVDFTVCQDTTTLRAANPGTGSGVWNVVISSGIVSFANQTNFVTHVSGLGTGLNTFRWTVTNGICSASSDVDVINNAPSPAITPGTAEICSPNTNLSATPPVIGTGLWTRTSGTGTIVDPSNNNASVTGIAAGISNFQWTVTNGGCSDYDILTITNNMVTANANSDQVVCVDFTNLNAIPAGSGATGVWTLEAGLPTVIIANSTLATSAVSNLGSGVTTFRWTLTKGSCSNYDLVEINNRAVTASATDQLACSSTFTLDGNDPSLLGATGLWSKVGAGSGTITISSLYNTTITGVNNESTTTLRWTVSNSNCSESTDITVTNNSFGISTPADWIGCTSSTTVTGDDPVSVGSGTGFGTWTLVAGSGNIVNSNNYTTSITNLGQGTNTFQWTITDNGCTNSALVNLTNNSPSAAIITGPAVPQVCDGSVTLSATNPAIGIGSWTQESGSGTFANPSTSNNLTVNGLSPDNNVFRWTVVNNGCPDSETITITNNQVSSIAGSDQLVCVDNATLNATDPSTTIYGGTGSWSNLSGGGIVITNSMLFNTTVTNLPSNISTFRWSVTKGTCPAETDDVQINNQSINAIATDITTCSLPVSLTGNDPSTFSGTGQWSIVGGTVNFIDANSLYNARIDGIPEENSATLRWTVNRGTCSDNTDIVIANNDFALGAGPDQTLCAANTTLAGDNIGTGFWQVVAGTAIFGNSASPTSTVSGLAPGNNVLRWTVTNNGCTKPADVTITNNSPSAANITGPVITEVCDGSVTLSATNPAIGSGVWTQESGSGTFANPSTSNILTVNGLSPDNNVFRWTVTNNGCPQSQTITITNNQVYSLAGADQLVCGDNATLNATDPSTTIYGGSGTWTNLSGGAIVITNSLLFNTTVTNLPSNISTFRWSVTKGACPPKTDDVQINNQSINAIATNITTCSLPVSLTGNDPAGFGGSGMWTTVGGTVSYIDAQSLYNASINGIPEGNSATLKWTVTRGTCTDNTDIVVTNNNFILSAGPDQNLCNNSTSLAANNIGTGYWTVIAGNGIFGNSTSAASTVTNMQPGVNVYRWTVTLNSCTNFADVTVTNNLPSAANITGPAITEVCDGNVTLSASNPVIGTGSWQQIVGSGTFVDPSSSNNLNVTGLSPNDNIFRWTVTNGVCTSTPDEITITNNQVVSEAGNLQTICDNFTNLQATDPSTSIYGGTGHWENLSGGGIIISNSLNPTTLVSNLPINTSTFRWVVSKGTCPPVNDEVQIDNRSINASATDINSCTLPVQLTGNDPSTFSGTGHWSVIGSGTINFIDANTLYNAQVDGIPEENEVTLRWTVTRGACSDYTDIKVRNNNFLLSAGADQTVCTNSATLGAQNIGSGSWQVIAGSALFANSTNPATTASNLGPNNNVLRWTVTNNGCTNYSDVTINNRSVSASVIAGTINVCSSTATMNALDPAPNSGNWTLVSGIANINTPTFHNSTVDITGSSATFRWTVSNESCSAANNVSVNNNSITLNGSTQSTCSFNGTLNAGSLAVGQTGEWTAASSNPIIANSTDPFTNVSNLDFGTNVFFWTVTTASGCTASAQHDIVNNSPSVPNAGVDQNICVNNTTISANNPLYGTGNWTQVGGNTTGVVITDPTNSSTTVTGLDIGSSTFRWTISYNGCSAADEVVINNNSFDLSAGVDETLCGSSTNFGADAVPVGGSGQWQLVGGTGIIATTNSNTSAVSSLGQGTNTFRWTVTNVEGCTVSDEVQITNNQPSTPNVSGNQTTCNNSITISGDAPPLNATGSWTRGAGSANIINANSNVTLVTNLSDNNQFIWTIDKFGCTASNTVTITYNGVTASANEDFATCDNFADLKAANPVAGTGAWTLQSGTGIIANTAAFETTVSGLSQGDNVFRWTVTRLGCSRYDEITITNNAPDLADAGTTINTCNSTFSLLGNNPVIGVGTWTKSVGSSATIINPTLYNTAVNMPIAAMPYSETFTWTITNGACFDDDIVIVNNNAFIVYANADDYTCDGSYTMLGRDPASVSGTAIGNWTVSIGSGIFSNSMLYNATVSGLNPGVNSFRWTITDNGCAGYDDVVITNDQVTSSNTGFMTCNSSAAILANNPTLQTATGLWTVDNQTTQVIANPTSYSTTVSGLVANAVNRLRWTVSRGACSVSDTLNVEYYVPNANITIPDIAHGCADTVQLIADSNIGTGVGVWTESTGSVAITFDNNTMATTIARNLPITNNTFIWTVTNRGCVSSDQIVINNSKPINTAGTDKAGCTNTFTMNAQVPTATGSGVWSLISGNVAFGNANSASTIVTADPGTNIIDWTITDNGCSATKRFNVANNLTSPNAGTDVSVCQNSVNLAGNILKTGETGVWSIDGGIVSESFSSTTINNPLVSNLRQGNITFVWTVSNGTCSAEDRVVITNNTPFVDAGPDLTICEDYVTLNGNNPDAGKGESGLWTIGNTNVQIANPTFYNTTVTNLGQGSNLFKWTVSNTNCTTFDEVAITSNAIDVVAGLPYSEGCAVSLNLEATQPPVGTTGIWTAVDGGGPFDNASSYATTVRNLQPYNKLRWTISDGTCSFYDEIEYVSLAPTQANAGKDTAVCANFIQITANPASGIGESGLWSKVGGSTAVTIATPTSFQTIVNNLDPGPNNFRWTISNASCSTSDMVTVTNNEVFSDAGQDQVICTENYAISANVITGTGVWTSSTPGTVIASSTSENTNVSNLAFGDNKFTWTVTYNGCTDDDEVIIRSDLPRNVSAGSDQNICSASTNLAGTNPGSGTGLWEVTGGAGTFASATANQTTVSGISSGENIYKWTVTVGTCSASSQVRVNNNSLYVTAGTDQTLCNQDTLILDGTIPGPGITGTWSVNGGTGIFDNSTQNNSVVRNITKGSNTYRWTLTDGSCTNYADVKVINNTPDLAVVGADQQICTDNAIINAIAVTNGTGLWSRKSGSGTITSPSSNNTTVTGINVGLNTYTWTVTKNGCSLSDDINITNNSVSAYIADDDITICTPTHTATIIGNAVGTGETGFWAKISAGPGIITASTSNVTTVTNLGNGETYFRWTVANGLCTNSDDLKITNNYYNTTANPAGPNTLCVDYSTVIGGSLPVGATGKWSSTAPDVTFDNNTLVSTIARNLPGGTSAITWTVTKDGCSSPASFNFLNNAIYTSAGADQVVCNTSTSLNAQGLLPGETGYWTVNNALVTIANSTNPASSVSGLITGDNTFTWTLNGNGCTVSDQMIVSNNTFSVDAGVNQISCGPSYTLRGSDPLVGTGLWTIASGTGRFITPTNFETLVEDMNNGPNTFTWTVNRNGCVASANVTITNDLYVAVAGDDRSVCSGQTTVSAQPLNAGWGAIGNWTAQTGGGTFANPSLASSLVSNLSSGDNRLRWTVTKGSCVSFDEIVINNMAITASAGTDETTCDNFASLSATPLSATGVGKWTTGGAGLVTIVNPTSANTSVLNLQQGVNTFAWTVTDQGCTGTSTVRITSNFFTARAGNDQIVTVDYALLDGRLPAASATGSWSVFSGSGAFANANDGSTSVSSLGFGSNTFRWTVSWNGCDAFDDVDIIYNVVTAEAGANQTICTDNTYLSADDPWPGTGSWSRISGGGTIVNPLNRTTQVTGINPGSINIYRWTVVIPGYSEYDDVVVTNGQFRTSAGADRASCNNFNTMAAASPGSGTGAWTILSGSGNFTDPSSNISAVTNLGDTPNLFVWTVTKPTGCVDSDTVQVIYNVPPTASFTATPSTGCSPIDVTYQNNSTDGSSYYWNYGEDQKWDYSIKDTTIQYIAYDNDSVYTTTLIAYSNAGCSDTVSHTITAYGIPKVAILAYPTNQLYPDATVFVENNSGDGYPNYYWTFGDTETQLDNTRIPQIQHTYATWGTYEITLAVTSATCSDTARATINILAPKPTDISSRNYYSDCEPRTLTIPAATDYADTFEWNIVDSRGDTIETRFEEDPTIIFLEAGRYYVHLRATGPGGTENIRTDTVDIFHVPEVDFIITPDTVMLPNQPIHCYNRSTYGDLYEWDFGDTSKVSFEENPLHYYTKEGIYPVTLRVYTENGCFNSKTTDVGIVVEKPGVCRFPNAFTPSISGSSDGHYDPDAVNNVVFHPVHRGIREYKLEIFNRWGEKLFESTDPTIGWDGYSNGKLAPQDVYVWKVTGKFKNGVIFKDAGDVTLLR